MLAFTKQATVVLHESGRPCLYALGHAVRQDNPLCQVSRRNFLVICFVSHFRVRFSLFVSSRSGRFSSKLKPSLLHTLACRRGGVCCYSYCEDWIVLSWGGLRRSRLFCRPSQPENIYFYRTSMSMEQHIAAQFNSIGVHNDTTAFKIPG